MRRPEKMAEVLREEIAEIVGFELVDPRLQMVTVTEVRVSDNLRDATVYAVVEGSEKEKVEAFGVLQKASGYVRQQVAHSLNLRHAPVLHFIRDTVEENAVRIDELIEEVSHENKSDHE